MIHLRYKKGKEQIKMNRFAIVGFGSRGTMFANLIARDKESELVAVAEKYPHNRRKAHEEFGVPEKMCFESAESFFEAGKLCDAVFICTQDAQHYAHAMKALELGYDICLEKPAAVTIEQCVEIRDTANRLGRKVMLTHVLRYSPFYKKIKELIDNGSLGQVVTVNQTENVAYWHFALSYVRGPWRRMEESTPTIIAKCCHDLDIIGWLMGEKCTAVNSFGGLYYYNADHAPEKSAEFCVDCDESVKEKCLYNAYKIYPERIKKAVVGGLSEYGDRDIYDLLADRKHVWGRCVFHGDNDAVDHQVVDMLFESGATAHLTMTAFSERCYRFIKVHGTDGEVFGDVDEGILHYTPFGGKEQLIDVNVGAEVELDDGHGGGDYYLYQDFKEYITTGKPSVSRTSIDKSIESHLIGFLAEESRKNGGKTMQIK